MRMEQLNSEALKRTGGDRYVLAVAVSKRVAQLMAGAEPKVDADIKKVEPTNIALEEIAKGLVDVEVR